MQVTGSQLKKKNTLIYIISHASKQQTDKNWQFFIADPLWKKVYAASRENGPIVKNLTSEYLTATNFSPLK
ncbi:NIPSNAP family protein [Paraglaciecola arctica]|uniref:NIPSNAP domain-containing protein n=1 Tax=Paraglaciecola arctica BSs20135 TaxID=493475 RepID=K6Z932_9ALTE|nr:hypothetical protein GARC_2987 [Paraglaciecola arctica BSs20135]